MGDLTVPRSGWRILTLVVVAAWVASVLVAPSLVGWTTCGVLALGIARITAAARTAHQRGVGLLHLARRHGDALRSAGDASVVRPTYRLEGEVGDAAPSDLLDAGHVGDEPDGMDLDAAGRQAAPRTGRRVERRHR